LTAPDIISARRIASSFLRSLSRDLLSAISFFLFFLFFLKKKATCVCMSVKRLIRFQSKVFHFVTPPQSPQMLDEFLELFAKKNIQTVLRRTLLQSSSLKGNRKAQIQREEAKVLFSFFFFIFIFFSCLGNLGLLFAFCIFSVGL
jgi:hypothetical protein